MMAIMAIIERFQDLVEDMEAYKQQFPDTFVPYAKIKESLQERVNDPVGSIFGLSVATDWEDKCYGFEVDRVTPETTVFIYCGTWKT